MTIEADDVVYLKSRLDEIHKMIIDEQSGINSVVTVQSSSQGYDLNDLVNWEVKIRRARQAHMAKGLFDWPAWDMLLDLTLAERSQRSLCASDLANGANVALTSGLRAVDNLVRSGMASRESDSKDRRRSLIKLTPEGRSTIESYFRSVAPDISAYTAASEAQKVA
jgi:DNA-binding MarR family transcriptional regulator